MLKLKEIRENKNVLQKDLAEAIQRTRACVSQWEVGKTEPSINDLNEIANYLQCTVDELLGREDYATGNVVIEGTQLSADEQQLLELYRMLTVRDKAELIGFAKGLAC